MWRTGVAVCLGVSLTATSVAQVAAPRRAAPSPQAKPSITQIPDSVLERYVGFEGREIKTTSQDVELALAELVSRAKNKQDGRAAFLVGREYQVPANSARTTQPETAVSWYRYGSTLGDPSAVEAYSMCLRKGYGGVIQNTAQADTLTAWAVAHGYAGNQDHQSVAYNQAIYDRRKQQEQQQAQSADGTGLILGVAALVGLAALLSGSGSHAASGNGSDSASDTPQSTPQLKSCMVPYDMLVFDGGGQTHTERRNRQGFGYECP